MLFNFLFDLGRFFFIHLLRYPVSNFEQRFRWLLPRGYFVQVFLPRVIDVVLELGLLELV